MGQIIFHLELLLWHIFYNKKEDLFISLLMMEYLFGKVLRRFKVTTIVV